MLVHILLIDSLNSLILTNEEHYHRIGSARIADFRDTFEICSAVLEFFDWDHLKI